MMPSSDKNTYPAPAAQEAVASRSPEAELAYQSAMEHAASTGELNTEDVDRHRVEGYGATMLAAAEAVTQPTNEVYFDPTDVEQLLNCGRGVEYLRKAAIKQSDLERAA